MVATKSLAYFKSHTKENKILFVRGTDKSSVIGVFDREN